MPTYGLTTEGFLAKTLDIIRADISAALQQAFGPTIRTDDQSILGQIVGIVAERLALLWELLEVIYGMLDPDSATGAALEQLCLLTGTTRPPATYSAVNLVLTGDPTTVIPAGNKEKTLSTAAEFATDNNVTLVAVPAWIAAHPYVAGDRVTANGHVYQCVTAGTSDFGIAPVAEPPSFLDVAASPHDRDDIPDGTVVWVYLGEGTAAGDTTGSATSSGVIPAAAFDLTEIVNFITGWNSVVNLNDAVLGRDIATDAELRLLREQELATGGSTTVNALRAEILRVLDVVAVSIFENNTDFTDADGLPPHSVEAVVRGPDSPSAAFDQAIGDALLNGVAAGIKTASATGATTVSVTSFDDELTGHTMTFSRPTDVLIYIDVALIKNPDEYPTDGDEQVKLAISNFWATQSTGRDAVSSVISAQCFKIPGVLDVTHCYVDDAPAPTTPTTVAISKRQLAKIDTSRIAVVSTNGVP
jgi:hypothetical protein